MIFFFFWSTYFSYRMDRFKKLLTTMRSIYLLLKLNDVNDVSEWVNVNILIKRHLNLRWLTIIVFQLKISQLPWASAGIGICILVDSLVLLSSVFIRSCRSDRLWYYSLTAEFCSIFLQPIYECKDGVFVSFNCILSTQNIQSLLGPPYKCNSRSMWINSINQR